MKVNGMRFTGHAVTHLMDIAEKTIVIVYVEGSTEDEVYYR